MVAKESSHSSDSCEDKNDTETDAKIRGNAWLTLWGTVISGCFGTATALLLANTRNTLKPVMPLLTDSALASNLLVSAPNAIGSLARIPAAVLLEKCCTRRLHVYINAISLVGIIGLMILSFITADTNPLGTFVYVLYVLFGIVGGMGLAIFAIGITTTTFWAPSYKHGTMNGIYGGTTNLMPGLMGMLFAWMIGVMSLGWSYAVWVVMLVIAMAVSTPLTFNPPFQQLKLAKTAKKLDVTPEDTERFKDTFPGGNLKRTLLSSVSSWRTWALVYLYNVSFGGFLALSVYLPTFFDDHYGTNGTNTVTKTSAGFIGAGYGIVAAIARIPAGYASDLITFMHGGVFVEFVSMIVYGVGAAVVVIFPSFVLNLIGVTLLALGTGGGNAGTFKILPKFADSPVAGVSGWVSGFGAFGGIVWPLLLGALSGLSSSPDKHFVFSLFIVISALACLVTILIGWQLRRDQAAASTTPVVQPPPPPYGNADTTTPLLAVGHGNAKQGNDTMKT